MAEVTATTTKIVETKKEVPVEPQAMQTTLYHKDTGAPLIVYVVDAAEILAAPDSPYTREKPDGQAKAASASAPANLGGTGGIGPVEDTRSKAELQEALEAKGITVRSNATKADLLRLLELDTKTKSQLVEMVEAKGLEAKGTKAELINALADAG